MNILKHLRKRRPVVHVEQLTLGRIQDLRVASAWGLDEAGWDSLTDFERAECRRLVTTAPRFQP